jgi:AraC-like DNA-binding protein
MDKTNIPVHRLAEMTKSPRSSPDAARVIEVLTYGSEETMRRSFLRLLAVTPQDYRSRFTN